MSRSLKKIIFVDNHLLKSVNDNLNKSKHIKTRSRRSTILSNFVGLKFLIHNGKKFVPLSVTRDMVGHKLGEFSFTRNFNGHSKNKKN